MNDEIVDEMQETFYKYNVCGESVKSIITIAAICSTVFLCSTASIISSGGDNK